MARIRKVTSLERLRQSASQTRAARDAVDRDLMSRLEKLPGVNVGSRIGKPMPRPQSDQERSFRMEQLAKQAEELKPKFSTFAPTAKQLIELKRRAEEIAKRFE